VGGGTEEGSPRVSVLLPVRDGEAHLEQAVRSILAQTYRSLELIAVDDGSRDRTGEILRALGEDDPRVTTISTEPRGIIPALETARSRARGELLARMDADDVSHPERLAKQVGLMDAAPDVVLCGTQVEYFPRRGLKDGARRYESWLNSTHDHRDIERELFVECPLAHPTFLLRAEALENAGGYRDRGWPEDYDLVLRLWRAGGRFGRVPEVLLRWRDGPQRLSRTDERYAPDAFRACKIHHLRQGPLLLEGGASREVVLCGAGPVGKAMARALMEAGTSVAAFVDLSPRKIGQTIHGAPVLGPEQVPPPRSDGSGPVALGAVGQVGARAEIRALFGAAGWVEGRDLWMVA
jgi:GT2 family glycosyltransferase